MRGVSLTHSVLASLFIWGVSLTHPMLVLLFTGGVSLTHLMLASFLSGECLLHIPYRFLSFFLLFYLGSFSGTQPYLKTTPKKKKKSWVEYGPEKKVKKSHSKQKRNATTPYTEQNKTKQELSDKWPQKRKANKRNGS